MSRIFELSNYLVLTNSLICQFGSLFMSRIFESSYYLVLINFLILQFGSFFSSCWRTTFVLFRQEVFVNTFSQLIIRDKVHKLGENGLSGWHDESKLDKYYIQNNEIFIKKFTKCHNELNINKLHG